MNAEWALKSVADQLHARFGELSDAYLKERSTDLDDVLGRLRLNLAGRADAPSLSRLPGRFVLVAPDVTPSEAAELDWERVVGIATDLGSRTDHAAIVARSRGIPTVMGLRDASRRIPPGALVVVDGTRGRVEVEPSTPALEGYRAAQEDDRREEARLQETRALPALTRDGVPVSLQANVEFPDEVATARRYGALGIGLFRSEYLLGRSRGWPSEERQVAVYRGLLEAMRPDPVTIRTWDVGAHDLTPGGPTSPNPALGERALRLLRRAPEPFLAQLRALLRAACHGPLKIMFPFVSGPADLRVALELLTAARAQLKAEGLDAPDRVPVGVNLEVPSALLTADLLAPDVDFFSIGTNDLIQYLLAVDRSDPRLASLYQPLHPAVLRTLRQAVVVAGQRGIPLAVCGEMAGDPFLALLLVGLGIRELSMTPAAIPRVKEAIRAVRVEHLSEVALSLLSLAEAEEVESRLKDALAPASRKEQRRD